MSVRNTLRILFNASTVLSLVMTIGVALLWARSYRTPDAIAHVTLTRRLGLQSERGIAYFYRRFTPNDPSQAGWWWFTFASAQRKNTGGILGFSHYVLGATEGWTVPHAALVCMAGVLPTMWGLSHLRFRRRSDQRSCPTCGYDLRATPNRCPECGSVPTEA